MASRRWTLEGALCTTPAKEAALHSDELGSDKYDMTPRFSEDVTEIKAGSAASKINAIFEPWFSRMEDENCPVTNL